MLRVRGNFIENRLSVLVSAQKNRLFGQNNPVVGTCLSLKSTEKLLGIKKMSVRYIESLTVSKKLAYNRALLTKIENNLIMA